MKLLFVLENYHPFIGGAEVLFKNLCEGLAARGHEVRVITSRQPASPHDETLNGVSILRLNTPLRASRYWFTFQAVPAAVKLAAWADCVLTTTYNGAFPAWLAARLRGKPCMITVLEIIGEGWKDMAGMGPFKAWLHRFLERRVVSLHFDRYVAISQYTAGRLRESGTPASRIAVVYPGIDYGLFDPANANGKGIREKLSPGDDFIFLYYGRPGASKGVEYLIEAVPLVAGNITNSRLVMLLAREPAEGYERITGLIRRLGIADRVNVHDPVPRSELPSWIAAVDCVVVPSLSEGFGFSAAEACAMGVPVVASDVASLPEVVSGKHVLVKPRSAAAIALGIEAVYNKAERVTAAKVFKWPDCIARYEELIAGLQMKRKEI